MGNQNLTQADLAKASGLTRTAISDYINQKRTNPEPHALIALAKALHVSPLNIFRVAGLLPDDHLSENDRFLNDWREILSGLQSEIRNYSSKWQLPCEVRRRNETTTDMMMKHEPTPPAVQIGEDDREKRIAWLRCGQKGERHQVARIDRHLGV